MSSHINFFNARISERISLRLSLYFKMLLMSQLTLSAPCLLGQGREGGHWVTGVDWKKASPGALARFKTQLKAHGSFF